MHFFIHRNNLKFQHRKKYSVIYPLIRVFCFYNSGDDGDLEYDGCRDMNYVNIEEVKNYILYRSKLLFRSKLYRGKRKRKCV